MRLKTVLTFGVVIALGFVLVSGGALTQQSQGQKTTISFTNVCQDRQVTITQIVLTDGRSIDISFTQLSLAPGQTQKVEKNLRFRPTRMGLGGAIDGQEFSLTIDPLPLNQTFTPEGAGGCLQILVEISGAQQPPTGEKPIAPGQNLQQVLNTLQARGIRADRIEGSQTSPKLGDVADPMLLRAIPGASLQLLWVSSGTGTLRSVITWDSPSVDLDLIVFGIPGGACFQLNGPGILSELCDRPADALHGPLGGPVAGVVFAVLIINWSGTPQPYVLSLSS